MNTKLEPNENIIGRLQVKFKNDFIPVLLLALIDTLSIFCVIQANNLKSTLTTSLALMLNIELLKYLKVSYYSSIGTTILATGLLLWFTFRKS